MMTVVRDMNPATNNLPDLLTRLKNACGAGGTVVESNLEIQGSHADRVRTELQKLGYRIRG
jgi:translation initiation factor 1